MEARIIRGDRLAARPGDAAEIWERKLAEIPGIAALPGETVERR